MSRVSDDKLQAVEQAARLLGEYEIVCAADLFKLESVMLQDLRKKLRGQMAIKCLKNTLMKIAIDKAGLGHGEEFIRRVEGPNIFIFANRNPFKLAMALSRDKVKVLAKPGDTALGDVVIPAGNTGLSPGPIIGKFGALGIRTRIEAGTIWVNQDSKVAEAGDKISGDMADILARLGIKAGEMGLSIKAIYDKRLIIPGKELLLDLAAYRAELERARGDAFQVALKSSYPTPQTLPLLIAMAAQSARRVAVQAEYVTPETAGELAARAHAQASALDQLVKGKESKPSA